MKERFEKLFLALFFCESIKKVFDKKQQQLTTAHEVVG